MKTAPPAIIKVENACLNCKRILENFNDRYCDHCKRIMESGRKDIRIDEFGRFHPRSKYS